ncbi:PHP domain-containing protein [Nocardioides cavernaquae]|uniref:PHP domain-containing protein n=1 Tax=Nocardioides cavernaquae TaxID=2321396 RepID=A0A3A5H7K7_9ACTN|nr:PHP domain-containing protein [Nocardioides cavernaquae]RJS46659.1 PHP domain-containing protein [Nocardioides cavernaquae]
MRIDLHTHSRISDGTQSPTELVHAAKAAGLDVLAITDHDTAAGWAEAARAADEVGIELVRGMEISTRHRGRAVHLLAYLPDPSYEPLVSGLQKVLDGRNSRVPAILERLDAIGLHLELAQVQAVSGDAAAVGRPHVADALVNAGYVRDRDQAFAELLSPGRPAYVDRYAAPLEPMIRTVAEAGGVSVIAHPWGRNNDAGPLGVDGLAGLRELGLAGIEVDHEDHDPETRTRLRAIARDLDLVATGSSDHHGVGKSGHGLGCNTTGPDQYARLLDLAAAASALSGRSTPQVVTP